MKVFDVYQGKEVHSIVLENEVIRLHLIDFGATIVSCVLKENNVDIVQGFDHVSGYVNEERYMGATVGRVCNRIGKGQFELNGKRYHTPINNGPNTLHGGPQGFDHQIFDVVEASNEHVIFEYLSPDNEEGFPGNLTLKVEYRLLEDGFVFETEAVCDQDTLCSITNHAFFNLNGCTSSSALNHHIKINADLVGKSDADGLTLEEAFDVTDTPFDFRKGALLRDCILMETQNEQLQMGQGFDHCFVLNGSGLKDAVIAEGDQVVMKIQTTLPCVHVYSGNFQNGTASGKLNTKYQRRSSICFEPEYYPNAIQYEKWEKPVLKKGEVQKHRTEYHFRGKEII